MRLYYTKLQYNKLTCVSWRGNERLEAHVGVVTEQATVEAACVLNGTPPATARVGNMCRWRRHHRIKRHADHGRRLHRMTAASRRQWRWDRSLSWQRRWPLKLVHKAEHWLVIVYHIARLCVRGTARRQRWRRKRKSGKGVAKARQKRSRVRKHERRIGICVGTNRGSSGGLTLTTVAVTSSAQVGSGRRVACCWDYCGTTRCWRNGRNGCGRDGTRSNIAVWWRDKRLGEVCGHSVGRRRLLHHYRAWRWRRDGHRSHIVGRVLSQRPVAAIWNILRVARRTCCRSRCDVHGHGNNGTNNGLARTAIAWHVGGRSLVIWQTKVGGRTKYRPSNALDWRRPVQAGWQELRLALGWRRLGHVGRNLLDISTTVTPMLVVVTVPGGNTLHRLVNITERWISVHRNWHNHRQLTAGIIRKHRWRPTKHLSATRGWNFYTWHTHTRLQLLLIWSIQCKPSQHSPRTT